MEAQEKLDIKIGTKEPDKKALKPAKVKIVNVTIEFIEKAKADKAIFEIKHPDKEETIHLSSVAYLDGREIKVSGTWYNLIKEEEQELIVKGSALAVLMNKLNVNSLREIIGKEIDTEEDGKYLCLKAY